MAKNFHEEFAPEGIRPPSERSTGLTFAVVALIVAYFWRDRLVTPVIAVLAAASLLFLSLLAPRLLKPINIAWFRLSLLLNKVMSPLIMLALFLVVIVPFGLVMQIVRDPLHKRRKGDAKSYWVERDQQQTTSSMTNQF